jgi:hypothetical protein
VPVERDFMRRGGQQDPSRTTSSPPEFVGEAARAKTEHAVLYLSIRIPVMKVWARNASYS